MASTTLRATVAQDEHPDELRRKLALLEGDRKAYYEGSQRAMRENKAQITQLRKENKTMAAKIKTLKVPRTSSGPSSNVVKEKIHSSKMKLNTLRHQAQQKTERLTELQKKLDEMQREEAAQSRNREGGSSEMQRLRTLENNLDKANIKAQEAQHIGRTYKEIIHKLQQDRLQFDATINKLEKTLEGRKQELTDLESMCNDACLARDQARQALAARESDLTKARAEREAEKQSVNALAEERRRQFEAMEKRLRLASAGVEKATRDDGDNAESKEKLETYEDAMRRIRDATGATDVGEVVQRFLTQGETQEHLRALQRENTEKLSNLREDHARLLKRFEALKYSGEARTTGNQRMLSEFENHLRDSEAKAAQAKETSDRLTKIIVNLQTGIEALHEKLSSITPVQFRAASTVQDKLTESSLRLKRLHETLEARKSELPGGLEPDSIPRVLPEHNVRIALDAPQEAAEDSDSADEDEVVSRDAMKRRALTLADSKSDKKRPVVPGL